MLIYIMLINKLWNPYLRLVDVFITGPLQIYVSNYISNKLLKYFMILTGLLNILFNGHNFLLTNHYIKTPFNILKLFISKNGKYQGHRIYNLFIMYPIFIYILLFFKLPPYVYNMFLINIVIGVLFNLYYYILINNKNNLLPTFTKIQSTRIIESMKNI